MKPSQSLVVCFSLIFMKASSLELTRTKFASHVSVNTPTSSFTHGVGDPVSVNRRTNRQPSFRGTKRPQRGHSTGYARQKPAIPFQVEEVPRHATVPWQFNYMDYSIPVLPPSPYKVDSPDPESLWPNGLFLPPIPPHLGHFGSSLRRLDDSNGETDNNNDPYLLEGTEAIAAVSKSRQHGMLYFHDIPHIQSLLENQELRIDNNLKPHRIGSIRHTWPYYRT